MRLGLLAMLQVKRVLADMPYSQVSCVNWKRTWQLASPDVAVMPKGPDVILRAPKPPPPVGILVNKDGAKTRNGPCAQCISVSSCSCLIAQVASCFVVVALFCVALYDV